MFYKTNPDYNFKPFILKGDGNEDKPYILRMAPQDDKLEFEWIDLKDRENNNCTAFISYDNKNFEKIPMHGNHAVLEVLPERDGWIYIETNDGRRSSTRPFRSGFYPGKVINYNHPDDNQYEFSGRYLGDPSILRLADGTLLVFMDTFAANMGMNLGFLFRSKDNGKTWDYVTDILPVCWGMLFEHKGKIYILAVTKEYGDLEIIESNDNGESWHGVIVDRGSGHCLNMGWHKGLGPIIKYNGRIWFALEYGAWAKNKFMPVVFSVGEDEDLMDINNWKHSGFFTADESLKGAEVSWGAIEGNLVVTPEGEIVNILRHGPNKALVLAVDKNNPEGDLKFKEFVDLPIAYSKFYIQKHDGMYYAMGNLSPFRNVLELYVSKDLHVWKKKKTLLDYSRYPARHTGIQYPTYIIEGNELKTVLRVGFNGANNFHDSNCITYNVFTI